MNTNWSTIKSNIDLFPEYRNSIFEQGFIVTNDIDILDKSFSFYNNWNEYYLDGIVIYTHSNQNLYVNETEYGTFFLIGHAYDPFSMIYDERELLENFANSSKGVFNKGIQCLNNWTGLFLFGLIKNDTVSFVCDYESMRTTYYGIVDDNWYIVSHEEILALHKNLTEDSYVKRLENYRWYYLFGEGLPGDIAHYRELKKVMCNCYVVFDGCGFSVQRFYPCGNIKVYRNDEEYDKAIEQIATLMKNSMDLIVNKWNRVAVSVTGGRDSKGTLAASVHLKDRLEFFSYNSQYAEKVDCDAAEEICKAAGLEHITYNIPLDMSVYPEYELVKAILSVNSNRKKFNRNDIMKRVYFKKENYFDVEVKSWTSEIGRAYYYQRYGIKHLQKRCTPRRVNTMNNVFLFNPLLMYQTDRRYRDYLSKTKFNEKIMNYDWSDFVMLEMRDSRWGADVISTEHMFSYDVTIPYNNRNLCDLMLAVPLELRIRDQIHIDMTNKMCPEIERTGINVRDYAHNHRRMMLERIYYLINSYRLI